MSFQLGPGFFFVMEIRDFQTEDYQQVVNLLKKEGVEPPKEVGELNGLCLVALSDNRVVGVVYALAGPSTKAYVDYLAVDPDYRGHLTFFRLMTRLAERLKEIGVKRYTFHLEKHNVSFFNQLYKHRERYGIEMLNDLYYFAREI